MIQEIEEINDSDEKIRIQLSRKERTNDLVRHNRNNLEKSLNNLEYLNISNKHSLSPSAEKIRTRTYN